MSLQDPHSFVPVCLFTMLHLLHGRIPAIQSGSASCFALDPLYHGATCHVVNIYILYYSVKVVYIKQAQESFPCPLLLFVVRYRLGQPFPGIVRTHSLQRVVRSDHDIRDVFIVEPVL